MTNSRFHRIAATLSVLALSFVGITACGDAQSPTAKESASATSSIQTSDTADSSKNTNKSSWPRTVKTLDGQGKETEVTIEKEPSRIVSASVTITGSLLSLDIPVVASGGGNGKSPIFTKEEGFANQWADIAKERNVKSLYQLEPNAEKIIAEKPDLVVMSSVGQDKALDIYDQIKAVVPVIVIDYSNKSWEDVTSYLGNSLGKEKEAEKLIADFKAKIAQAKEKIELPPQPVNVVSISRDGGMNFFTPKSAQGGLFQELGFEIQIPADELVGKTAQGTSRGDIKGVVAENIAPALKGETVFVMNLNQKEKDEDIIRNNPTLAHNPAIVNKRVVGLPAAAFRIDYYSANLLVDHLVDTYKK